MQPQKEKATWLFKEAGYEVRGGKLVDAKTGEPYTVEFLANEPSFERVFSTSLRSTGSELR